MFGTRTVRALLGVVLTAGAVLTSSTGTASAISSDYCGYAISAGQQCFEGSGYRGWRYHQASTGGSAVPSLCAYAWTGSNYRTGSGCAPSTGFYAFQYCSAEPTANSSVLWSGWAGTQTIYGHADSRACALAASGDGTGALDAYIAERFVDPTSAGQAGVDPATARIVANAHGTSVFVLTGERNRCVLRADADGWSTACTTATQVAAAEGLQTAAEIAGPERFRTYGVVGADTSSVAVETDGGGRQMVAPTAAGGFLVETRRRPRAVVTSRHGQDRVTSVSTQQP